MALTVEDGTGLAAADSYLSIADADTYHTDYGDFTTWDAAADAAKEKALRQATQYIDAKYLRRWQGTATLSTQALAWPRYGVVNPDGWALDSDIVPVGVERATAELAVLALSESLFVDSVDAGGLERERVKVGPLEIDQTFSGGSSGLTPAKLKYPRELLKPYVTPPNMVERA